MTTLARQPNTPPTMASWTTTSGPDRDPASGPAPDPWAKALRLIESGVSRRRAAEEAGMNFKTVYNRLRRIQEAHGFPPIPDARKRPRRQAAS